jgi:predicted lipid-binding transport protein (Tim44 family)
MLGTVARTAVIAGTASATANAVTRHGQQRAADQQQAAAYREQQAAAAQEPAAQQAAAPAQPPAAPSAASPPTGNDLVSQLTNLGQLRDSGVLTAEEFDLAKAKLLASS